MAIYSPTWLGCSCEACEGSVTASLKGLSACLGLVAAIRLSRASETSGHARERTSGSCQNLSPSAVASPTATAGRVSAEGLGQGHASLSKSEGAKLSRRRLESLRHLLTLLVRRSARIRLSITTEGGRRPGLKIRL